MCLLQRIKLDTWTTVCVMVEAEGVALGLLITPESVGINPRTVLTLCSTLSPLDNGARATELAQSNLKYHLQTIHVIGMYSFILLLPCCNNITRLIIMEFEGVLVFLGLRSCGTPL